MNVVPFPKGIRQWPEKFVSVRTHVYMGGSWSLEATDAIEHPTMYNTPSPHPRKYLIQNINDVQVEKS